MFLRGIAVVNVGVALALLFILVNIQFEYENTLREKERQVAEMSIDIMLSQIQPHFLCNALATISHLCKRDPMEAQKAIREFSAFLRANMDSLKKRTPIPFDQELNHVMNYLRLEQRRFQSRLRVVYETPVSNFMIPSLSLQPLVENAVRHGILKKEEGGMVIIRTRETEDAYLIDRRGASVTTGDAYAVLFENMENTVSGKGYFRNVVRDMKESLKAVGAEEILVRHFNQLAIVPELLDCDYYRFLQGDPTAVNAYRGDYLPQYSWAEFRNGELSL